MFSKYRKTVLAAIAVVAMFITACGGNSGGGAGSSASGGAKERRYALITHGAASDPFWSAVQDGAKAAAKQFGGEVTYQGDGNPVQQSILIDNAVAQKVDGIIVTMANPQGLKAAIEKAVKAGIPVIGANTGLTAWKSMGLMGYVGTDESLAGKLAGEKLKELGGKNAICVIGEQGQIALETRCKSFTEAFGGKSENLYVNINNVADSQNQIQAKLKADPSIDTVITTSATLAVGAEKAIEAVGRKVHMATFDTNADAPKYVEEGKYAFAVDQQPYLQGYLPVEFLDLWYKNGNTIGGGEAVLTGPTLVTKENAAQVYKYSQRGTR